ncbi:bifunctional (p)ppGpp synthetase/guanosine-3',5'-bis(diphosphate) 3'-pyrophosphohydrolase [Candidatus Woesearchaeota archaeon]|nr:bifunctional (p)ppGpp synthetase/guanosine-3',5'-bis(diphosphate) 3'-pyrophosphohydrolase [Candidatus Woesearchaeota archaeon]
MNEDTFLQICRAKGYAFIENKLSIAFRIAKKNLEPKMRLAGDTYLDHNIRVAQILMESNLDPSSVLSGLLHSCLSAEAEIKSNFNEDVWMLISGVAELKQLKNKNKQLEAEALRKVLLATIKDLRIIIIQLANKLDNLRQISFLDKASQLRISEEVLAFYAPLAYRLGMEKMRVEMENIAFATLNPKKYQEIANFLRDSEEERNKKVAQAIEEIKQIATDTKILKIKGRPKHIYSIYRKMSKRGVSLDKQYDLLGIRVLVPEVKDCYILLGKLHEHFTPVESRLKDYIANPKPNFYRSIHTAVILSQNKIVEVQIRTPEMDEYSEGGVAAHWSYKGGNYGDLFERKLSWLRSLLDLQKEGTTEEFLESAKIDLFADKIHCYTPKGEVKELPEKSTILDFAYAVHEEVGNKAIGGRVNGQFVPLKHPLNKGDVVEVVTNKNQHPRRSWLKLVVSGKTKQKIRKYLKVFEQLPVLHYRQLKPAMAEEQGILVESTEFPQAYCVLAKCCCPLPGEEIAGLVTKRRLISVHKIECKFAVKEEARLVAVNWKETINQKINYYVQAVERSGLLADVLHTIAQAGFEVKEAKAKLVDVGIVECSFILIPKSLAHILEMMKRVRKVKGIKKMSFG